MPQDNNKDSIVNTFLVAIGVCLVCSLMVSAAAIGLRSMQETNADKDRKKNILLAAGFSSEEITKNGGVFELFEHKVKPIIINLETGKEEGIETIVASDDAKADKMKTPEDAVAMYDQILASKKKIEGLYTEFADKKEDIAGISRKEIWSHVYLITDDAGQVEKYVFPIRGKGLWSILKGFLAVEKDFQTIAGITYYEHGETPGLGGEVDNPTWKKKWIGKKVFEGDEVKIEVIKGVAEADNPYAIDGLSGATITSRGVTYMIEYWLGPEGFGPYIDLQKNKKTASTATSTSGEG